MKPINPFRGISQKEIEKIHKKNKERDLLFDARIKEIMKKHKLK